ncbi:hypothetical protein TVAG_348310 [Trichomonas vaginalis G3]|uniref:RRM domain-containing protein n=1 Tax=Trichomonas vaginalis (strain ATCC PRA-98 / G3) TaxID=412133 RepID=A2DSX2_TRIV3|nr:T-BOX protein-related family [Trichomonas vaginalis G3]EAY16521.1 hypothetical protein TVAG_348310 [Trichomonas vaginalis G3]KAI5493576.1 T-BOX protein-related family [Trichomonas vaginalis G3]|eukprot:XP_001328744.1 hypothetical protein [Trichomonas vaginalis G3]
MNYNDGLRHKNSSKRKNLKPVLEFPPDNDYLQAQLHTEETYAEAYEHLQLDIVQLQTEVDALRLEADLAEKREKSNQYENKEFMQRHADLYNFDVTAETLREKQSRIVTLQQKSCDLENQITQLRKNTSPTALVDLRVEIGLIKKDIERYNDSIDTLAQERKRVGREIEIQRQKLGLEFIGDNQQYIAELKNLLLHKQEIYEQYKQDIQDLKKVIEDGNKLGFNNEILLERNLSTAQNKYNALMEQYVKQTKEFESNEVNQRQQARIEKKVTPIFFNQEDEEKKSSSRHMVGELPKPKTTGYIPTRNISEDNFDKLDTGEKRVQRAGNKREFIESHKNPSPPKNDKNITESKGKVEEKQPEPKDSAKNVENKPPEVVKKPEQKIENQNTKNESNKPVTTEQNKEVSISKPPASSSQPKQSSSPSTSIQMPTPSPTGFVSSRRTINITNLRNEHVAREICTKFGTILNITEDERSTRVTFINHEEAMKALIGSNGQKVENVFLNISWGPEPESVKKLQLEEKPAPKETKPPVVIIEPPKSQENSKPKEQIPQKEPPKPQEPVRQPDPVKPKEEIKPPKQNDKKDSEPEIEEEIIVEESSSLSSSSSSSSSSDSKNKKQENKKSDSEKEKKEEVPEKKETEHVEKKEEKPQEKKEDVKIEEKSSSSSEKEEKKEPEPIVEEEIILDESSDDDFDKTKTIQPSGQVFNSSSTSESDIIIDEASDDIKESSSDHPTKQQADPPTNQESSDDDEDSDAFF